VRWIRATSELSAVAIDASIRCRGVEQLLPPCY
jgi:hypothetical protein